MKWNADDGVDADLVGKCVFDKDSMPSLGSDASHLFVNAAKAVMKAIRDAKANAPQKGIGNSHKLLLSRFVQFMMKHFYKIENPTPAGWTLTVEAMLRHIGGDHGTVVLFQAVIHLASHTVTI